MSIPNSEPSIECEEAVIANIRQRRDVGRKKYGTTMERLDLDEGAWLQHAQEEAMDLAIYLERCIREQKKRKAGALVGSATPPSDSLQRVNPSSVNKV